MDEPQSNSVAEPQMWSILLVDDHPLIRHGLVRMVENEPDLSICGEAESAEEALELLKHLRPSLVLVDLSLRGKPGLELIKNIRTEHPETRVLVLSMHDEAVWAERVLRAGACGYVMKQEKPRVLMSRIRQALGGGICLSERMADQLLRKFTGHRIGGEKMPTEDLGDREMEVLQMIGQGMNTREIAKVLHVSVKTIEAHRENLKRKLNLGSAAELLRYAVLRFVDDN